MNPYEKPYEQSQHPDRDRLIREPRTEPGDWMSGGASALAPVGTGLGATAGTITGGDTGENASQPFEPTDVDELERFIDYTVVDLANDKVGSISAVWADRFGEPSYLAVRTGWLGLGRAHVVPAVSAQVNESRRQIRLPFTSEQIKDAPSFDSQDDITAEAETRIARHFNLPEPRSDDGLTPPSKPVDESDLGSHVTRRERDSGSVRLRKIAHPESVRESAESALDEAGRERAPTDRATPTAGQDVADEETYRPLRRERRETGRDDSHPTS